MLREEWFTYPELGAGCHVRHVAVIGNEDRPQKFWVFPPFTAPFLPPQAIMVFAQHPINAIIGFRMRVGMTVPALAEPNAWRMARREFQMLQKLYDLKNASVVPLSHKQLLARKSGASYRRYSRASLALRKYGLLEKDFSGELFVKTQNEVNLAPHETIGKAPRPRLVIHDGYKVIFELARFLSALEDHIYDCLTDSEDLHFAGSTRIHMKGISIAEIAQTIVTKTRDVAFESGGGWVAYEVDEKSFEAHVNRYQRWVFDQVCRQLFSSDAEWPTLKRILRAHYKLKATARSRQTGVWLVIEILNRLASGMSETAAIANVTVMGKFTLFMEDNQFTGYQAADNGDNLLIIVPAADEARLKALMPGWYLANYGAEISLEHRATQLSEIRFCRSGIFEVEANTYKMARPPERITAGLYVTHQNECKEKALARVMSKALTEYVLSRGQPVIPHIALRTYYQAREAFPVSKRSRLPRLLRPSKEDMWKYSTEFKGALMKEAGVDILSELKPPEPTKEARVSWGALWGISPDCQRSIEDKASSWMGGFASPPRQWGPTFDHWDPRWPYS